MAITRFDHGVVAASDLAEAKRWYEERLGLAVYVGGRHTGLGTENAIIRFGLDYLELLGIYDRAEVAAAGVKRASLLDYLARRQGGLLGYCLATDDIAQLADQFRDAGLDALGPYAMERMRPDGLLLKWQLLVPGGTAWRRRWPFFIQWEMEDSVRLQHEQPSKHLLGSNSVTGVRVAVSDPGSAFSLYRDQLGLNLWGSVQDEEWQATGSAFALPGCRIEVLAPRDTSSPLNAILAAEGEGVFEFLLNTPDIEATQKYLTETGTTPRRVKETQIIISEENALGARYRFCQEA
jgi:catechol 2,3-dioxygenase-like lactoylglutathione lyase family enzyme